MLICNVNVSVLEFVPAVNFPSLHAAFSAEVRGYVAACDTIMLSGDNCDDSIIGRITDVEPSFAKVQSFGEAIHPHINRSMPQNQSHDSFLRLNIYIQKYAPDSPHHDLWPQTEQNVLQACTGLTEVAVSNLVVWVSCRQVAEIVFVPHTNECLNHSFGPMSGRSHTYFTGNQVLFGSNASEFTFQPIEEKEYPNISPPCNEMSRPSTLTERLLEGIYAVTRVNTSLLTKAGQIFQGANAKLNLSRELWVYFQRRLAGAMHVAISTSHTITKQCVTHSNLSLESTKLRTTKNSIKATNVDGYNALRSVFSSLLGIGVKKRHPPLKSIGKAGKNPDALRYTDTVNICDVNLTNHDYSNEQWVYSQIQLVRPNCIALVYDSRLRELRVSIKCLSLKVGSCTAPELLDYLHRNAIHWPQIAVRAGTNIQYNGDMWVVSSVSGDRVVIFSNEFTGQSEELSVEQVLPLVL